MPLRDDQPFTPDGNPEVPAPCGCTREVREEKLPYQGGIFTAWLCEHNFVVYWAFTAGPGSGIGEAMVAAHTATIALADMFTRFADALRNPVTAGSLMAEIDYVRTVYGAQAAEYLIAFCNSIFNVEQSTMDMPNN